MAKTRVSQGRDSVMTSDDDQSTTFSAFGGHALPAARMEVASAGESYTATLASLGIEDAEQLVAIAAIPDVRNELEAMFGGADALKQMVDGAHNVLPPDRAALVGAPAPRDLSLGVLMPTAEIMAAAEKAASAAFDATPVALPTSVNLIPFMSPIRNQGAARGTCVSFTLTALNEYILRRRGQVQNLSEQHLYYETKLIDGSASLCGTWQEKGVLVLRDRGQCREVVWPYNPNPPCNNHGSLPSAARPDGLAFRLPTLVVAPRNVAQYKSHLALQRPVTLSMPVYNGWYQSAEVRRSGRITMRVGNEPSVGGHAVCLVGYQDSASSPGGGYFIVRNSWDTTWAYQSPYGGGYGTIPYQYITNEAWEAFTAVVPGVGDADTDTPQDTEASASVIVIEVGGSIKVRIPVPKA